MDLRRSLLTLLALVAAKTDKPSSSPAASAFVDELAKGEAGIIIEVGANTGAYSDKLMRRCQKAGVKVASLTLVDPQASMRRVLQKLAADAQSSACGDSSGAERARA
jgi:phospholipid N-methyltransferase